MPTPRLLSAAILSAALALGACGAGSGEHNQAEETDQVTGTDSVSAGTAVPSTLPPEGTVNPAAPSGPGTYPDSAVPTGMGQTQGATPGSSNPAAPVTSGTASDSTE